MWLKVIILGLGYLLYKIIFRDPSPPRPRIVQQLNYGLPSNNRTPIASKQSPTPSISNLADGEKKQDQSIKTTIFSVYSRTSAMAYLSSALVDIEAHEHRKLETLNRELDKFGPFQTYSLNTYSTGAQEPNSCIWLGQMLIDKLSKEIGIGICVNLKLSKIDGYSPKKRMVIDIRDKVLIVCGGKKELPPGKYYVTLAFKRDMRHKLLASNPQLSQFLFPSSPSTQICGKSEDLITVMDNINSIQRDAILRGINSKPGTPVLIRGPPGTGKTTTLIEMILQILKETEKGKDISNEDIFPSLPIVVCTPSNRAADNIIERIPTDKAWVLRYLSAAEHLKQTKQYPGIHYSSTLYTGYDVIVCTIGMLPTFYGDSGIRKIFPTHIIIDEASMVPDTDMILVLGLLNQSTRLVMFGDEKQLGPVITADKLRKSFLETSMFERLLGEKEHSRASVCLLENYRSCAGIVASFNNLFYEGRLISKVSKKTHRELFGQQQRIHCILTGRASRADSTGVYFKRVRDGRCEQGESKSWSNLKEANAIVRILESLINNGIEKSDIGIITPYMDQVNLIRRSTSLNVAVGTVDSFQGQERSVILITTVRSDKKAGIGFVGDQKRLNVTLSRAKAAMVLVGDDNVLKQNKWFRNLFNMNVINYIPEFQS